MLRWYTSFAFMFNGLMFCMLLCMLGFDDLRCMYGTIDCMLRVFDPGRLLVVRVGDLDELTTS